ncbi:Cob(I)yrinic acid a,c-diamide adenosyltransferase [Planctomycetes bacterium Pan216]|uniref:corrinoid adenosyltransferase n=1 Tax=Kolteria novifilia TaxID=2527975 RepID=A0A518B8M9_9BACT|nr:Cob(I)yrinic acid a,c-diamide adenosyltransferase [Planctomycetes bacterium Pan216]
MATEETDEHKARMKRKQEAYRQRLAKATESKGLLVVYTGAGKGKTTAALGLAFRAMGQGVRVGVIQFVKGAIATGEAALAQLESLPIDLHPMGEGFTWETQDRQRDVEIAEKAWQRAVEMLRDPSYGMVILDELNIVLRYDYLELETVLEELGQRREGLHVVVTGRNAKPALVEMADLATEMTYLKHPFKAGIKPQPGIEY